MDKDFYSQQREEYAGMYKDNNGNIYDLHEHCGYWSLFIRVGENGHTKTILDNSDLTSCLVVIKEKGLIRYAKEKE